MSFVLFCFLFFFFFVIFAEQNESQGVCLTENHMLLILTTANVTFGAKNILASDERPGATTRYNPDIIV